MSTQQTYASVVKAFAYLSAVVLAAIALGVGVSAPSWSHPLSQFNDQFLRFDYPSSWTSKTYLDESSFSSTIVFLSNETMHAPCEPYRDGIECSPPVSGLRPGGVFVEWTDNGFPGWNLGKQTGRSVAVDGHPGKEAVATGRGDCVSGTQLDITLVLARPYPDNYYEMDACLRGPSLAQERSEIQAMVASTKFLQP